MQSNDSNKNYICRKYPEACSDGLPEDFLYVAYPRFMQSVSISPEDHEHLGMRLEEYLECSIEFAGTSWACNMENVMGSFYSKNDLPQYCFTIYSLWGQPHKKRERIQRGATMKLHFTLNASRRQVPEDSEDTAVPLPRYNLPADLSVQVAAHSPYFLPSPHVDGMKFLKGRAYEMRITLQETQLLPEPYETNCTDYLRTWKQRGGRSAMNQLGVIQECRLKKMYEALQCIPLTFNYPHDYRICRSCPLECDYNVSTEECSLLADSYNQPCDTLTYSATKEPKLLTLFKKVDTKFLKITEGVAFRILSYNCTGGNFWSKECSSIDIDVIFDRFQSTKLTYNAKFESLEVFSVIGGYMGMWMGISLLTMYELATTLFSLMRKSLKKRKRKKLRMKSRDEKGALKISEYHNLHI